MRLPVTVADQGIFLAPDDADELVDLLTDAAAVIGSLAGSPAAEAALAAARLDEDTTAHRISGHIKKHSGKGDDATRKSTRHAGENQHSEERH